VVERDFVGERERDGKGVCVLVRFGVWLECGWRE